MTVPPVASPTSDTPRYPHKAYPALLGPQSPHIACLLETINGLSLQVDARFNALTAHFSDRYNQLDERISELASWFPPPSNDYIGRIQDGKTLKRLQNSTGRTGSSTDTTLGSTDTTKTSIGRMHSSVQGSFGLGSLPIQTEFYRYLENFYRNKSRK
ncbi:hypothetical protein Gogos_000926 [Gossypium gossypioides]|uniref:Uncharacterized protein n=1 Tax=Gossypium gossypioides TaxID=34282 RepID=A0A7J9CUZ0_GOSGO|nr:hypothetical protein [Gossypium gossypioides]